VVATLTDLNFLLELPKTVKCPHCERNVRSYFEDYEVQDHYLVDGLLSLGVHCTACSVDFEIQYVIAVARVGE